MSGAELHDVWRHGEDMLALSVFFVTCRGAFIAIIKGFLD